ncbi:hypothetical protein CCUS01_06257 [Colletotrichum cuscutae]|uniref:Uncharacterized protein n=1 Tax=Colletotrichum cuscutae TaxID=1209917 RepID=A0AAI9V4I7_9PEZI|nr:hypothetical protein CCUS01_06257 [Colletotrichum cuscutae]
MKQVANVNFADLNITTHVPLCLSLPLYAYSILLYECRILTYRLANDALYLLDNGVSTKLSSLVVKQAVAVIVFDVTVDHYLKCR